MSIQAEWQASMRCGKRDIRLWMSVNFAGVKNSKSIPTKSLIDRCENVINFEVVSKNTIKRDCSFNVYRQRKISLDDRVVVEGSKAASINQYGTGPRHPKTGHVDNFRKRSNKNLKLPILYLRPQIKSTCQFLANSVRQRLFNIVRILHTTALKAFHLLCW